MSAALRTNDPAFMVPTERWINRLAQEDRPTADRSRRPHHITQVENEYGSFHQTRHHATRPHPRLHDPHARHLRRAGFTDSLLDTVDGGDELPFGGMPGVFTGVNFGIGQHSPKMDKLAAFQPGKPLFVTEYWPGWFDYWGHPHQTRPLATQLEDIDYILNRGDGINLYMFHGGTSFGFMSGANWNDNTYFSDVTSYDYGAPLDEAGHPTPKFLAFRKIFAKYASCSSPSSKDEGKNVSSMNKAQRSEGPALQLLPVTTQPAKPASHDIPEPTSRHHHPHHYPLRIHAPLD